MRLHKIFYALKLIAESPNVFKDPDLKTSFQTNNSSYTSLKILFQEFILPNRLKGKLDRDELNYLLFKSVANYRLKNVFLDTIENMQSLDLLTGTNWLNNYVNQSNAHFEQHLISELNSDTDINMLMDMPSPENHRLSIPYFFVKNNTLFLLVCAAEKINNTSETTIAAITIDLQNGSMVSRIRNNSLLNKYFNLRDYPYYADAKKLSKTDCPTTFDADIIYTFICETILKHVLGLKFTPHNTSIEKNAMYQMNHELVDKLLARPKEKLLKQTHNKEMISDQTAEILRTVTGLTNDPVSQKEITNKIFDVYLSSFISKHYSATKLRNGAQTNGSLGFPTGIKFNGENNGSSNVKAGSRVSPLVSTELFFDVQQSLNKSQQLKVWRISWFKSYLYKDDEIHASQVVQTTIYAWPNTFKIVFKPTYVDEAIINTTVNTLQKIIGKEVP